MVHILQRDDESSGFPLLSSYPEAITSWRGRSTFIFFGVATSLRFKTSSGSRVVFTAVLLKSFEL